MPSYYFCGIIVYKKGQICITFVESYNVYNSGARVTFKEAAISLSRHIFNVTSSDEGNRLFSRGVLMTA